MGDLKKKKARTEEEYLEDFMMEFRKCIQKFYELQKKKNKIVEDTNKEDKSIQTERKLESKLVPVFLLKNIDKS